MKIWGSKGEGLSRTNKMRQKGSKNREKILRKELKDMLDLIYNFNLHNPDATSAKIDFINKGLVPLLEEKGYKLEFQYELGCRFYYIISWEQYRMNIKWIQFLTKKNSKRREKQLEREEYKLIKSQIKEAMKEGKFHTFYHDYLLSDVANKLIQKGFKVEKISGYSEKWYISWEN